MIVVKNVGEKMVEQELQKDSLAQLQGIVGGYVDVVRLPLGIDLWVDDEALLKTEQPQPHFVISRGAQYDIQFIFGNVAFASTDNEGNTTPLNDDQKRYIAKRFEPFNSGFNQLYVLDISH